MKHAHHMQSLQSAVPHHYITYIQHMRAPWTCPCIKSQLGGLHACRARYEQLVLAMYADGLSSILEDVKQKLDLNLEDIRTRYAAFVSCIFDHLSDKKVNVNKLRIYLIGLPAMECNSNGEEFLLFSGIKDKLMKAVTIANIFEVLHKYGSFINYDVFQCILDHHNILPADDYEANILNYSEHLKSYLDNHTLSEFIELNPRLKKFDDPSKKLILKFDITLPTSVTKVVDLKKRIAKICKLQLSALRLVSIEKGCVLVMFLIPPFVPDLTSEQIQEMKTLPVLSLKCGDQIFHFKGSPTDAGKCYEVLCCTQEHVAKQL